MQGIQHFTLEDVVAAHKNMTMSHSRKKTFRVLYGETSILRCCELR